MKPQLPKGIDISQVDASYIKKLRKNIKAEATQCLFGIDKAADLVTECPFVLVPYDDSITNAKLAGQPHIMFKGGTGIGKTGLSKSIAGSVKAIFSRIQATPDMLAYDLLGAPILVENRRGERRVQFKPGPLFANIVLIDEDNRATPKTKAALLEALEERSVTPKNDYIDDEDNVVPTLPLFPITGDYRDMISPRFFWVLLTENIFGEEEGTYTNPMAEVDRITMTIPIDMPSFEEEKKIRAGNVLGRTIKPVGELTDILNCAYWINQNVKFSPAANDYLTLLLRSTRPDPKINNPKSKLGKFLREHVRVGASPRVNFHLEAVVKAHAFFGDDSTVVRPEHIKDIAGNVIEHRLLLVPGMEFKTTKEEVFAEILRLTDIPKWT